MFQMFGGVEPSFVVTVSHGAFFNLHVIFCLLVLGGYAETAGPPSAERGEGATDAQVHVQGQRHTINGREVRGE